MEANISGLQGKSSSTHPGWGCVHVTPVVLRMPNHWYMNLLESQPFKSMSTVFLINALKYPCVSRQTCTKQNIAEGSNDGHLYQSRHTLHPIYPGPCDKSKLGHSHLPHAIICAISKWNVTARWRFTTQKSPSRAWGWQKPKMRSRGTEI